MQTKKDFKAAVEILRQINRTATRKERKLLLTAFADFFQRTSFRFDRDLFIDSVQGLRGPL